ncbi:hypothetical protein PG996_001656 [Apiospora saccharicola]|uniref:Uncharacterized protein n=1 Tax=Apiospora saccharicola TaxID=335842 RepID=A0ABR1WH96_9PEZI
MRDRIDLIVLYGICMFLSIASNGSQVDIQVFSPCCKDGGLAPKANFALSNPACHFAALLHVTL